MPIDAVHFDIVINDIFGLLEWISSDFFTKVVSIYMHYMPHVKPSIIKIEGKNSQQERVVDAGSNKTISKKKVGVLAN